MLLTTSYQHSSTTAKPRTVRPRAAAMKDCQRWNTTDHPLFHYGIHSPLVSSNNWCDLLAAPQVIQYPDDILIAGWGSPYILDPSSIRLWRTIMQHYMQLVHDPQSPDATSVHSKEDQCQNKR